MVFFENFPQNDSSSLGDSLDHQDRFLWCPWLARSAVAHSGGPAVSVSAAAIFLHEVLTRKSIKMHSFSWKSMHFQRFSKSNWSFQSRKNIRNFAPTQELFLPEKLFAWGDSTFFIHTLNFQKFPVCYEISMGFYRKALQIKNLVEPVDFLPKSSNHSSEIFDSENKNLESGLYHPKSCS